MNQVHIINVFDNVNTTTYTTPTFFTDLAKADRAVEGMARYWIQEHGGQAKGVVEEEGGFVVVNNDGEVAMIYSVQTLHSAQEDFAADKIV